MNDQRLADEANRNCTRPDLEWAASPQGGIYLRDRQAATEQRTRDLARTRESERQKWLFRRRNPEKFT